MDAAPQPQAARTEELAPAFQLLFRHLSEPERENRVARALHLLQQKELDPQGVRVVRGNGGVLAALVCLPVPGASGLLWPPQSVADADQAGREDALVRDACSWLRGRGTKLVQALLAPEEVSLAAPLQRNGFVHVTHLWYLRHDLNVPVRRLNTPVRLAFQSYDADPSAFHQTLFRTYEGSQDCPEVTGVRTLEEIIAGHQAQGRFDPERWWLALEDGRPVAVLLTTEMLESGAWEVAYVGVVPEGRGRGLGRELMLKALFEARAAGVPQLTLSVDGRNRPAWQLYRGLGFEPYDRREVYLAIWK
jgi:ribosomal protein S18 acetylase RimI-like enzyme